MGEPFRSRLHMPHRCYFLLLALRIVATRHDNTVHRECILACNLCITDPNDKILTYKGRFMAYGACIIADQGCLLGRSNVLWLYCGPYGLHHGHQMLHCG